VINLSIITPVYPPAPGGAAAYTKHLAIGLSKSSSVEKIRIYTESFPSELSHTVSSANKVEVNRLFPCRAGRDTIDVKSYINYIQQNISFMRLASWLPASTNTLLVHSSFHYKLNLLGFGVQKLRKLCSGRIRIILDVRDPVMPPKCMTTLKLYDGVICCSGNVSQHIEQHIDASSPPLFLIPIILEVKKPSLSDIELTLCKYGLTSSPFILATNGISIAKKIDETIDLVRALRASGHDLRLVVIGRKRDWGARHDNAVLEGALIYLGSLPQNEVLALMAGSEIHVNLSPIESPSRASLEAIGVGTRALLPTNVPEFDETVPEFVAAVDSPNNLVTQVTRMLSLPKRPPPYPLERHLPDVVIPKYLEVFNKIID